MATASETCPSCHKDVPPTASARGYDYRPDPNAPLPHPPEPTLSGYPSEERALGRPRVNWTLPAVVRRCVRDHEGEARFQREVAICGLHRYQDTGLPMMRALLAAILVVLAGCAIPPTTPPPPPQITTYAEFRSHYASNAAIDRFMTEAQAQTLSARIG